MKMKFLKNNPMAGFTLIESIVAVTVLVLAIVGPLQIASKGIAAMKISKNQVIATYLAQEAMEFIRFRRDSNLLNGRPWLWKLGPCNSSNGCWIDVVSDDIGACASSCKFIKFNASSGAYNYGSGDDTIFRRATKITSVGGEEIKVETKVEWQDAFSVKEIVLEEYLYEY